MASSVQKELKKIRAEAERQGWRIRKTPGGHWAYYAPDGINIVHSASTPSDRRSLDNFISDLRKYGFVWKGH